MSAMSYVQKKTPDPFLHTVQWNWRAELESRDVRRTDPKHMELQNELYDEWKNSSVLVQSGLQERWLAEDMECNCYLRNIQDLLADVQTL